MHSFRIFGATLVAVPAALLAQNPKTQPRTRASQPTTAAITANDLKTRLYIYAADSMEGRETGTRGHVKATNYIAAQLRALGLKPMGDNGTYFQNVPVIRSALDPSSTIIADGVTLHAGTDFIASPGRGNTGAFPSAVVVYGGVAGEGTPLGSDQARGKIELLRQPANAGRGGFGGRGAFGRGAANANGAAATITVMDELSPTLVQNALH